MAAGVRSGRRRAMVSVIANGFTRSLRLLASAAADHVRAMFGQASAGHLAGAKSRTRVEVTCSRIIAR
jgi:hypothetical protein